MKFAVISDIHSNATALRLVLNAIKAHGGIERILCTGDIVGFHTSPSDCIDLLQEAQAECIAGNHDLGVTGGGGQNMFPPECWEAIQWTREKLSRTHLTFLESLPRESIIAEQLWLMHGIFGNPYHYMTGPWIIRYAFVRLRLAGYRLGFYGHTHHHMCFHMNNRTVPLGVYARNASGEVRLEGSSSYLVNPGTVGQPRSNDSSARFAIIDLDNDVLRFERIPYDYDTVVRQTLKVFPGHLSMYKRFGWSSL